MTNENKLALSILSFGGLSVLLELIISERSVSWVAIIFIFLILILSKKRVKNFQMWLKRK
jgi:hypothetical protein